jgi:mono/diheme cytochrome c family protein
MRVWHFAVLGLAAGTACTVAGPAPAEDIPGDPVAGRALVMKECVECHSVSAEQRARRLDIAPGFDEIANKPQTTAISLRAFLQQSHPTMPNFMLNQTERDNAIAYILSLQQQSH